MTKVSHTLVLLFLAAITPIVYGVKGGGMVAASTGGDFNDAYDFVRGEEGGYANHPNDGGGETNYGVSQGVYDTYRDRHKLTRQSTKYISEAEVRDIYHEFWKAGNCDQYSSPLDIGCFDSVINFGVVGGKSFFEDLPSDPVAATQELANRREAYREERVNEKPSQRVFLEGWLNRDRRLRSLKPMDTPVE